MVSFIRANESSGRRHAAEAPSSPLSPMGRRGMDWPGEDTVRAEGQQVTIRPDGEVHDRLVVFAAHEGLAAGGEVPDADDAVERAGEDALEFRGPGDGEEVPGAGGQGRQGTTCADVPEPDRTIPTDRGEAAAIR